MADVFISYKKQRARAVSDLAAIIEAHGFSTWFDVRSLPIGPSFGPEIERALRLAKVTVVLWCSLSKESEWVIEEASLAKRLGRYLPLHMEVDPAPLGFRNDQAIDLTNWSGSPTDPILDGLFDELEKRLAQPAVARRTTLRLIEERWISNGRPGFTHCELDKLAPDESAIHRVFNSAELQSELTIIPEKNQVAGDSAASAAAWAETTGSHSLEDFEHFILAFPNSAEVGLCRQERDTLVRALEFRSLDPAGYDPVPFDKFLQRHPNSAEAFQAAKLRSGVDARFREHRPTTEDVLKAWELEAAVCLLLSRPIPPERAPHLHTLALHTYEKRLFAALEKSGADLSELFVGPPEKPPLRPSFRRVSKFNDTSRLASFSRVEALDLKCSSVYDLEPLGRLTSLASLDLSLTQTRDLSPLAKLQRLAALKLDSTFVADVTPIACCSSLRVLSISGNTPVNTVSGLNALSKLRELYVGKYFSDIESLSAITGLSTLGLSCRIDNILPLRSLPVLAELRFGEEFINISQLSSFENLLSLSLRGEGVVDISPLQNLRNLVRLDLSWTGVRDLRPLRNLSALSELDLSHTPVSDVSPLRSLPNLRSLHLWGSEVKNLEPVRHIPNVTGAE